MIDELCLTTTKSVVSGNECSTMATTYVLKIDEMKWLIETDWEKKKKKGFWVVILDFKSVYRYCLFAENWNLIAENIVAK